MTHGNTRVCADCAAWKYEHENSEGRSNPVGVCEKLSLIVLQGDYLGPDTVGGFHCAAHFGCVLWELRR